MLSLSCKAAVKAVIFLASKSETGEKSGIKEIAAFIDENEHTVGKLLQKLVKEGNINSSKGPAGGFYVTEKQKKQPLIQIIDTIDGKEVFKECGLGLSKCAATHPCPIHNDYKEVRDVYEQLCRKKTIQELCVPVNSGKTFLAGL